MGIKALKPLAWSLVASGALCCSLFGQAPSGAHTFVPDYTKGPSWFPGVLRPYQPISIPPLVMENSPRLHDLIHSGKLELSLADALALAIENNLDIAVQRYLRPVAQADVLRTESGQAARGVTGALLPSGLSVGALGVGVNQFQGAGGVGSAGGISGGGGAVQIPPLGAFDPSVSFNWSWDRTVAPLNTVQVAGVPRVTTYSNAFSGSYTQMLGDGTSYFVALNGIRQSSTQQFLLYNPAVIARFATGFNQPLLNGFGRVPNKRFLLVAQNDLRTSEEIFRQQVTATIVRVEDAYWNLAASRENVRVAEQSLAAAQTLYRDTQRQADVGAVALLDVAPTKSQMAAAQRDLVVAQTNFQLQQTELKNLLTKRIDPDLDAAEILTTDQLPQPQDADVPDLERSLQTAFARRPDLITAENDVRNQEISIGFTRNGLMPAANAFGLYAGTGLAGNSSAITAASAANGQLTDAGVAQSLSQGFQAAYPEYASGLSVVLPLRNRAAQADNLRARLEGDQLQVSRQRLREQVSLEVRQAMIGLIQGRAQVDAAREAVNLALQTRDAERLKLQEGLSVSYNVILRERDLVAAQQAEVAVIAAYAIALVEMDRSRGEILERNGIDLSDALAGTLSSRPTPPFRFPRYPGVQQENP